MVLGQSIKIESRKMWWIFLVENQKGKQFIGGKALWLLSVEINGIRNLKRVENNDIKGNGFL